MKEFLKRKNIEISLKRYGIDALGAMAQGLFCSLLIGTIIKTLGSQLGIGFLTDIGSYAMAVSGPAMAIAIGYALKADPMVLFSLAAVGWAANAEGFHWLQSAGRRMRKAARAVRWPFSSSPSSRRNLAKRSPRRRRSTCS